MAKKSFEGQVHTWVIKKDKRAIIYKTKEKKEEKGIEKREIRSLGHVRRDLLLNSTLISLTFLH